MAKQKTVAYVLNQESKRIFTALGNGTKRELLNTLNLIKDILKENENVLSTTKKEEHDYMNDAQRCVNVLTKCLNNQSRFLSTLVTWMSCIKVK